MGVDLAVVALRGGVEDVPGLLHALLAALDVVDYLDELFRVEAVGLGVSGVHAVQSAPLILNLPVRSVDFRADFVELAQVRVILRKLRPELHVHQRGPLDVALELAQVVLEGERTDAVEVVFGLGDLVLDDLLVAEDGEVHVEGRFVNLRLRELLEGLLLLLDVLEQEEGVADAQVDVVGELLDAIEELEGV